MSKKPLNPFRPGAGHPPPYLAGREHEKREFTHLLDQQVITDNPIVTGLRGVGKTVLLEELKLLAIKAEWFWVGTDLSESASLTDENMAIRLLTDLAVVTAQWELSGNQEQAWFHKLAASTDPRLGFNKLSEIFNGTPGLITDKLKAVLELVGRLLQPLDRGLIFAYDEAQNLSDHAADKQFPLSVMLDVFQSLQRKGHRIMLALVGLPTLFPKLVEARTSAERMFHVITLDRLTDKDSRDAITKPIQNQNSPLKPRDSLVSDIVRASGGYPYFIQFICREVYDIALQKRDRGEPLVVSIPDVTRKLDADFFAGRWAKATDRQRELLGVIAELDNHGTDFSVQEVVAKANELHKSHRLDETFKASNVNQMLAKLATAGFVFKTQHGRYSFAVPLLGQFIRRQRMP
jgi:Cdc6-like AAA superfamily ATPase